MVASEIQRIYGNQRLVFALVIGQHFLIGILNYSLLVEREGPYLYLFLERPESPSPIGVWSIFHDDVSRRLGSLHLIIWKDSKRDRFFLFFLNRIFNVAEVLVRGDRVVRVQFVKETNDVSFVKWRHWARPSPLNKVIIRLLRNNVIIEYREVATSPYLCCTEVVSIDLLEDGWKFA